MTAIEITGLSGVTSYPCQIYACDVYQDNCILISTIPIPITPPLTILLPFPFNTAPSVTIKIIDSNNCEIVREYICYIV